MADIGSDLLHWRRSTWSYECLYAWIGSLQSPNHCCHKTSPAPLRSHLFLVMCPRTHNSKYTPLNLGRRKRLTWDSLLHTLFSRTVFLPHAFVIFLQEDKVRKAKRIELPARKGRTVLSAKVLTTFSPNFSQFRPGVPTWNSKCLYNTPIFLLSRNRKK